MQVKGRFIGTETKVTPTNKKNVLSSTTEARHENRVKQFTTSAFK